LYKAVALSINAHHDGGSKADEFRIDPDLAEG
jgi:hypothetical protein